MPATDPILRGVIFDMDGCLVDSEPLCLSVIADEMQRLGINDVTAEDIGARFLGVSLSKIETFASERLGYPVPEGFADRIETTLIEIYQTRLSHMTGAGDVLNRLLGSGISLAIATGASVKRMRATLEISGLMNRFAESAVSAEEVKAGKPEPDIFFEAARRLNLSPSSCVVVEDSPHGVTGAVRAGMPAIGFVGGSHLEGRRQQQIDVLRDAGATKVFHQLDSLCDFILSAVETGP